MKDQFSTLCGYNYKDQMQIEKDSYRYINLVLFVLGAAINSTPSQVFSGVSPTISRVYDVSQLQVNSINAIYSISYVVMLLPANYILDKKGLKIGTLACQITNIIGLAIRLLINVDYSFFLIGTFISSLGFCFMFSAASSFTSVWFPKKEIFVANSICIFALFTSDAIGSFLSSFFIHQTSSKDEIYQFLVWQSSVMIAIQILKAIFFRGKPKAIQNYASQTHRNGYMEDLKQLLKNKNYIILFSSITFILSNAIIMFVFLPWVSEYYGYENWMNGVIILTANLSGCISCSLLGFIKENITYKKLCLLCGLGSVISLILLAVSFQVRAPIFTFIMAGFNGIFTYPLLSTTSSFAVQTTFPVGEATSGGILLFGGQFLGALMVIGFSLIFVGQSASNTRALLGIIVSLVTIGVTIMYFSKEQYKRDQYQSTKSMQNSLIEPEETMK